MGRGMWLAMRDHPEFSGQFLWAGIDYLGESRNWPVVGSASGLIDRDGGVKPMGRERQSWWSDKPMVAIARRVGAEEAAAIDPGYELVDNARRQTTYADWTPRNTAPHRENVEVYSNCEDVELFLNGKSLGAQKIHPDASPRTWQVDYEPGILKAVAKDVSAELRTAGKPAQIRLTAETAHDAVVFVTAAVVDENNIPVPNAADLITFKLTGTAKILAVDNADNSSHESFHSNQRHAFQGQAIAIVQANSRTTLSASAEGLRPASLALH
jgi:beta-galactosidase